MKNEYVYVAKVEGMRCGSCEAHVNDVIRRNFNIKKVKSSHLFKKTKIYSESELNVDDIKKIIEEEGYTVKSVELIK